MWRVLLVDDDEDLLALSVVSLRQMEPMFTVISTTSCLLALQKLTDETFDALIVDYEMPEMDGLEFLEKLRSTGNETPFIMFTGRGREEVAMRALNSGADYYLMKQGSPASVYGELAHVTKKAIQQKHTNEALAVAEREKSVILDSFADIMVSINERYEIAWVNEAAVRTYGVPEDLCVGKRCYEVFHSLDVPCHNCPATDVFVTGEATEFEVKNDNGTIWWYRAFPIRDEDANLVGALKVCSDITESMNAQEALRASEMRYQHLFNNAPVALYRTRTSDGTMIECNDSCAHMFGYDSREQCVAEMVTSEHYVDSHVRERMINEIQTRGEVYNFEAQGVKRDGSPIWASFSAKLFPDDGYMEGVITDISARKDAEAALATSELKHKQLFDNAQVGLFRTNIADGRLLACNHLFAQMVAFDSCEECMRVFVTSEHYIGRDNRQRMIDELDANGEVRNFEAHVTKADGTPFWVSVSARVFPEFGYIEGAITDITESKKLEADLKDSEARFRDMVENLTIGITLHDGDGQSISGNQALFDMAGVSDFQELTRTHLFDPDILSSQYEEQLRKGEVVSYEVSIDQSLREYYPAREGVNELQVQIVPLGASEGEAPTGFMVQTVDVTDQKNAEQRTRSLFEDSPTPMMLLDCSNLKRFVDDLNEHGVLDYQSYFDTHANELNQLARNIEIIDVNKACIALYSAPNKEEYLATLDKHVGPKELSVIRGILNLVVCGQTAVTKPMTTFSWAGDAVYVMAYMVIPPKHSNTWSRVNVSLVDVTALTAAQQALDASNMRFKGFADMLPQAVFELDATGIITFFNRFALGTLGYTDKEIAFNMSILDFLVNTDGERAIENLAAFRSTIEHGLNEQNMRRKDGTSFPVLMNATPIVVEGEPIGWRGIVIDISERKAALRILEQQKQELSEFARALVHDFKGKIANISGYVDFVKQTGDVNYCDKIQRLIHGTQIVMSRSVELAEAGQIIGSLEDVDLVEVVNEVADQIVPETVVFSATDLPIVKGDRAKLSQMFENLFANAVTHGEPTEIEVSHEESVDGLCLLVTNDGNPILTENRDHVLEEGFTTRVKGGGFGLKIVKKIVEAHDWQISLDKAEKTTFRIHIPV